MVHPTTHSQISWPPVSIVLHASLWRVQAFASLVFEYTNAERAHLCSANSSVWLRPQLSASLHH